MRGPRPGPVERVAAANRFLAQTGHKRNREHRRCRVRRGEAANRFQRGPAATERGSVGRYRMITSKRKPLAYARGSDSGSGAALLDPR